DAAARALLDDVQVDGRGVVHHVGVVLPREDVARAAHVGGQLVDLVEAPVEHFAAQPLLAQVAEHELVRGTGRELRQLEIDGSHEETFGLEAPHEMRGDEPAAAEDQSAMHACHGNDSTMKAEYAFRAGSSPAGGLGL